MKMIQGGIALLLVFSCVVMLVDRLFLPSDEAGRARAVASVVVAKKWQVTVAPKVGRSGIVGFAISDGVTSYNLLVPSGHLANEEFRTLEGNVAFVPCNCMGDGSTLPAGYFAPDTPKVRAKLRLVSSAH